MPPQKLTATLKANRHCDPQKHPMRCKDVGSKNRQTKMKRKFPDTIVGQYGPPKIGGE